MSYRHYTTCPHCSKEFREREAKSRDELVCDRCKKVIDREKSEPSMVQLSKMGQTFCFDICADCREMLGLSQPVQHPLMLGLSQPVQHP